MTWGVESAEMEEDEFDDNGFPSYDSSAQVPEESFENQSLLPLESINVEGCNDGDQEDRLSVKEEEDDGEDDNGVDPSLVCDDGSNATELHSSTQEKHEDSGGTTQDFREQDDTSKLDSTNKNHVTVEGSINAVNCDVAEALSSFQEDFDDLAFTEKGGVSSRPTSDETNVEECIRGSEKTPDDERSLTQKTQDEKQPGEDAEFVFLDADSGVLPATTAIEEDASSRTAVPAGGTEEFDPGPSRDDRKITREPDEGSSDVVDSGSSSEDDSNLSTKSGKGSRVSTKWNFLPTLFLFCILAFNGGVAALTVIPGDVLASSGSIARLRCSTDHSSPVYWERRLFGSDEQETIYYGKNGLARIAGDRISVDEDSTSGRYDLVISNVQLEDAGTYTCIDEAGIGEGYPAELVVSERFTCEMPVPRYGFMGENIFDIPEDPVESTCSLAFRGNVVPRFQWTWGKLSRLVTPTVINGSTVTSSVTLRATHDLNGARLTCLPVVSTGATSLDETPRWISESVLVRYVHVVFGSVEECQSSAMIPVCIPNCTYKVHKPSDDKCQCLAVYNDQGRTYNKIFSEYSCEISVWPRNTVITVVVSIVGTFAIVAVVASTIFAIRRVKLMCKERGLLKGNQPKNKNEVMANSDIEARIPNENEYSDSAHNLFKTTCEALHQDWPKSVEQALL